MRGILPLSLLMLAATSVTASAQGGPTSYFSTPQTWSGCYVGANAGGAFNGRSTKDNTASTGEFTFQASLDHNKLSGGEAGGQLGCNFERSHIVFGPELEGWYQDLTGSSVKPLPPQFGEEFLHTFVKSSYGAAASMRLGYALGRALVYGKGGVALSTFRYSGYVAGTDNVPLDRDRTSTKVSVGYLVGGGVEMALSPHWSAKVEYDYLDFGVTKHTFALDLDYAGANSITFLGSARSKESEQLARAGVDYHF